ncbi:MAG: NAD(P)-binding protein [Gemmatimonadaceae bacterium]|jgi:spermidine dehydrogenase|nr:NAD(P)-binding protein [Gemmatimonadaceae bacterium]
MDAPDPPRDGISRRDFLNGVAVGVGGALHLPRWLDTARAPDAPYPPAQTGMRGAHEGAFEALHALRDGQFWRAAPPVTETGERYDVVIVGAGLSGLAAAHYVRAARPRARILLLDNHDDFGGHAKRNEFTVGDRTLVTYGGTQSIDSPRRYSRVAMAMLDTLGVDVSRWPRDHDAALFERYGLRQATFFDRATFGRDALIAGRRRTPDRAFLDAAPLSATVRRDIERLTTTTQDPWPTLSPQDARARLATMSYRDFLLRVREVDDGVLPLYQTATHGLYGAGIDAVPAQDAHGLELPGFGGMRLGPGPGPGQNYDSIRDPGADDFYYHFPDGNATLARLLVRRLIPAAVPGTTVADSITARVRYDRLDRANAAVRLRLSAPVLRVRHVGAEPTRHVEVTYARGSRLESVRADRVVLACWHSVIPYICPELPEAQRTALDFATKVPLVYTNVLLRNWNAFVTAGVRTVIAPSGWHSYLALDQPVSRGRYTSSASPDAPIVVCCSRSPCRPGLPIREQHRVGRAELLATPFATIERTLRAEFDAMFGPSGFDASRDILAITVNRWPHGYSYQYNSLYDDFWRRGETTPCERARVPFGRITIANADAGAYAYTDGAFDQARRAVDELLSA